MAIASSAAPRLTERLEEANMGNAVDHHIADNNKKLLLNTSLYFPRNIISLVLAFGNKVKVARNISYQQRQLHFEEVEEKVTLKM